MNAELARRNMIQNQIRPWEALDPEVLGSLSIVTREHVVPAAYRDLAFAGFEIPLPCGQHTLASRIEACILQAAAPPLSRAYAVEIGAGSGYMEALLAQRPLPRWLYSQQRRALPAWL